MISLERAAIQFAADLLPSDDLPEVAADALVSGHDSPALRELAGTARTDVRTARDLFIAVLGELRILFPASDERKPLAYLTASDVADGRLDPIEGAHLIWHHCWWQMGAPRNGPYSRVRPRRPTITPTAVPSTRS